MNVPQLVLTELHDQIANIYSALDTQVTRMAQVQADLDEVRAKLALFTGVASDD
jgi:hypothetical protein